jgi:hypothetical protein
MSEISVREALTQAIRYWELRRIIYNAVLLLVVAAMFIKGMPISLSQVNLNLLLFLFVLAVLANVAYCACYVVDVVAQLSGFRAVWLRYRWLLLVVGVAFAAVLTYFFATGMFVARE